MEKKNKPSFGEFIRILRKRVGLTATVLSEMLNKGSAYVTQIENGRNRNPDYETARKLMELLRVDTNEIDKLLNEFNITPSRISNTEDKEKEFVMTMIQDIINEPDDYNINNDDFDDSDVEQLKRDLKFRVKRLNINLNKLIDYYPSSMSNGYISEMELRVEEFYKDAAKNTLEELKEKNPKLLEEMIKLSDMYKDLAYKTLKK